MFAPMRPRPTIPNCMCCSLNARSALSEVEGASLAVAAKLSQCLLHRRCQGRQTRFHIVQMHAEGTPSALGQHLKIAASLRGFYHAESVLLFGHRQFQRIVASHLQKYSGIRTAFVRLPRRMQKTRSKAQAGGHVLPVADRKSYRL